MPLLRLDTATRTDLSDDLLDEVSYTYDALSNIETRTETFALEGDGTTTTTTKYDYNADGAPTAVHVTSGGSPTVTTYLTWDNFEPDPTDATTGTVTKANGNLVGVGSAPGGPYAVSFGFDRRNRLTKVETNGVDGAARSASSEPC